MMEEQMNKNLEESAPESAESPRFSVGTRLEEKDMHKFLFQATFFGNKKMLPMLAGLSLMIAALFSMSKGYLTAWSLLTNWAGYFTLMVLLLVIQVELRNSQRKRMDKSGAMGSLTQMSFYEERMAMQNETLHSQGEVLYSQLSRICESPEYIVFYLQQNQATVLRKKDLASPEEAQSLSSFLKEKVGGRYTTM